MKKLNLNTRRNAFTLAEVLITIGVIGVVAAMTIPILISNYQKRQTVTRLKETYSQIIQAIRLSVNENEEVSGWDAGDECWFDKYITPFLKTSKREFKDVNEADSIPILDLNGDRESGLVIVRPAEFGKKSYTYTMINGVDLILTHNSTLRDTLLVDVNGLNTKPNQFGKDIFMFTLWEDGAFLPFGYRSTGEYTVPENKTEMRNFLKNPPISYKYGCNKQERGPFCAALIMLDNWQISSDYPWK